MTAHRFLDASGQESYGRYRIRPDGANEYLDAATAAARAQDFLFDDIRRDC